MSPTTTKTKTKQKPLTFSIASVLLLLTACIGQSMVSADGQLSDRRPRTLSASTKLTGEAEHRNRRGIETVEWRQDPVGQGTGTEGDERDNRDEGVLLGRLARSRRQAPSQQNMTTIVHLNDSHSMMYINWAGAGSQVIVALARDLNPTSTSTSKLFISYDYGNTFQQKNLSYTTSTPALLHSFLNSPVFNSHYVFVDVIHRAIWTTMDYGVTMQQRNLLFVPQIIELHPTNYNYMFGYDTNDFTERLWITTDFGSTWRVLHSGVDKFYWGVPPYDNETTVYIHASSGSSWLTTTSKIIRYRSLSANAAPEELFTDSLDLLVANEFIFATKRGNADTNYTLDLYVSYNRESFRRAHFPSRHNFLEFFVADADEDQVFVCACINTTSTNLYISDYRGDRYSLSLENIMFYSPNSAFSWMSGGSQPFADLRRVKGLNGIYVATKVVSATLYSSSINQVTLMSFNKGGDWHNIPAPERNATGSPTCGRTNPGATPQPNCYLHLMEKFLALTSYSRFASVFTSASAIGLVIANGNIGSRISNTGFNVYLSNDGGLRFKEVLSGTHYYTMGDHGGLIVAIRMYEITGELLYSTNEGQTWTEFTFISSPKIRVYGLLTEPGEQTATFSIFGSLANSTRHSWVVIQVNLTSVLGRPCNDSDYKQWAPTDDPSIDCLLGRHTIYERRRGNTVCFNGRDYDREISTENCQCKINDYECDYGYKKNLTNLNTCEYDTESGVNITAVPGFCREGAYYNRTKGYRRIVGDTCEGGQATQYDPVQTICPVAGNQEFLLFSNRTTIHRYIFTRQLDEVLPLDSVLENAISVDYDYANDCVFWADSRQHNIKMRCLRGNDVMTKVIITENADSIEGLAYNWMSEQLFWVDSGNKRIEVARRDGSHRRVLFNTTLDLPRALALYPKFGFLFWSDWSTTNPRVTKSAMDGANPVAIVQGSSFLHWPNGLAIDELTLKLFITDAYLDRIVSCDFNGRGFSILYSQSTLLQHPYAIGVFKDQLYWTDWSLRAVMAASKYGNQTIRMLIPGIPGIMDLKVFHRTSQNGQSACNVSSSRCQSLCFEKPNALSTQTNDFRCHCSDLLVENPNGSCSCAAGLNMTVNGTCHVTDGASSCASYQFSCRNGNCIPSRFRCDGDNDCLDMSDELGCDYNTCRFDQFQCNNGRCIPQSYRCDHDNDCGDMSDEPETCDFGTCPPNYFQCSNGRCILSSWQCDYDNDCQDGSDELNCSYSTRYPSCSTSQFQCLYPQVCIPRSWVCDRDRDCTDGSDEANCTTASPAPCTGWKCNSSSTCLPMEFRCNGRPDCIDESDEMGCSTAAPMSTTRSPCLSSEFQCTSGQWCIPFQGVCDGITDCPDNSDEIDCDCPVSDHFRCSNGRCIQSILRCNRRDDCRDNSDELDCGRTTTSQPCPSYKFLCNDGSCIPQTYVCDGENDCSGGEDERFCASYAPTTCSSTSFRCPISGECIPLMGVCNGIEECRDKTDESYCHSTPPDSCPLNQWQCESGECIYDRLRCDGFSDCVSRGDETNCINVTASLSIKTFDTNSIDIRVNALIPPISGQVKFFAVMRRESTGLVESEFWTNLTTTPATIEFDNLSPNTVYLITVAVNVNGTQGPATGSVRQRTEASFLRAPTPPRNIKAKNIVVNREFLLNVSWDAPENPNGVIQFYKIYVYDLDQKAGENSVFRVPGTSRSRVFGKTDIPYGHKFQFQMSASNGQESYLSDFTTSEYKADKCIRTNCSVVATSKETVAMTANMTSSNFEKKIYLSWSYSGNESADGIKIYVIRLSSSSVHFRQVFTYTGFTPSPNGHYVAIGGLNPGTEYDVAIIAYDRENTSIPLCPNNCDSIETPGTLISGPVIFAVATSEKISLNLSYNLEQLQNMTQLNSVSSDTETHLVVFYKELDRIHGDHLSLFYNSSNVTIPIQLGAGFSHYSMVHPFTGLVHCRRYCFLALITWPVRSQISNMDCSFVFNNTAPMSGLRVITDRVYGFFVDVLISWTDVCASEGPRYYTIFVKDIAKNVSHAFHYESLWNSSLSTVLTYLQRGALYRITVQRTEPYSVPVDYDYASDPLPAPTRPNVLIRSDDSVFLSWTLPVIENNSECALKYHVYYAKANESYAILTETSEDSIAVKGKKGNGNSAPIFFKVCILSCRGLCGEFSETVSLLEYDNVITDSAPFVDPNTGGRSNSMALAVSIPLTVIIVIMLAILGVLCGRHYLLRQSLQRFERSRYDSHSNSGLFRDLVDDDPPLVQNFNEDVPMIVP